MDRQVKCTKCGYIGSETEFPKGNDFFQNSYISDCPKCDNRQNPGDASMRMFGGDRPFVFVEKLEKQDTKDALTTVLRQANEAS